MKRLYLLLSFCLVYVPLAAGPAQAQPAPLPREAVCVNLGGDALSLHIWSATEIAEWEAKTGVSVARTHPATGTCYDPAGLMLFGGRGDPENWAYDCYRDEAGWVGPQWSLRIYRLPGVARAAVDSLTGSCPGPVTSRVGNTSEVTRAAAIAVYLSQLEMSGDLNVLYDWLHPDAQALIPATALTGWYQNEWRPRGPAAIQVDQVRFVNWTWPVTGELYPNTAEVAYHQTFADGSTVDDVAHLVQIPEGAWRWFFGRDQPFLDNVIATYED